MISLTLTAFFLFSHMALRQTPYCFVYHLATAPNSRTLFVLLLSTLWFRSIKINRKIKISLAALQNPSVIHCLQRTPQIFLPCMQSLPHSGTRLVFFPVYLSLLSTKYLQSIQTGQVSHSFLLAFCPLSPMPKMTSHHVPNFCHSPFVCHSLREAFLRLLRKAVTFSSEASQNFVFISQASHFITTNVIFFLPT